MKLDIINNLYWMQLQKLPSIWLDSSTTISFPNRAATIDRSKRFEFNSIYYKDDPYKQKKKVDQFMFPHDILINFRKCIRDASSKSNSKEKDRFNKKKKHTQEENILQANTLSPRSNKITKKLYQKPVQMSNAHDSFGNRSSFEKNKNQIVKLPYFQAISHKDKSQNIYITASQRLNLGKPINFNPGPGAYLTKNLQTYKSGLNRSLNNESTMSKHELNKIKPNRGYNSIV